MYLVRIFRPYWYSVEGPCQKVLYYFYLVDGITFCITKSILYSLVILHKIKLKAHGCEICKYRGRPHYSFMQLYEHLPIIANIEQS